MSHYNDMSIGYGYEQILKDVENNESFEAILPYLRELQIQFKYYTTPNKNQGNMIPALDDAGRKKYLDTLYDALKEVAKLQNGNTLGAEDKKILDRISSSLDGDSFAVNNYNPSKGYMNMVHIFESNRPIVVDISGNDIKKVGGAQSSRLPFVYKAPNGESYDGFFTESVEYNPEKEWDNYCANSWMRGEATNFAKCILNTAIADVKKNIDDYLADPKGNAKSIIKFGKVLQDKIKSGKTAEITKSEYIEAAMTKFEREQKKNAIVVTDESLDKIVELMPKSGVQGEKISSYENAREFYNKRKNNPNDGFLNPIKRFIGSCANKYAFHMIAEIQPESRIDSRNAAMSAMADLLGKPNIISKAIPMSVKSGKYEMKGTFMATAEGIDPALRTKEDMHIKSSDLNKSTALASMADLQVIDFICGNIDRHRANFIYQLDKSTGKITSVIGIDNDLSFGTYVPKDQTDYAQHLTPLDRMVAITSSMAEKIKSLTKDQLMHTLTPFQLSDDQKEACWQRLDMLRTNVVQNEEVYKTHKGSGFISGKIKIVPDQDFTKLNLKDLKPDSGENIFSKTKVLDLKLSPRQHNKRVDVTKKRYIYDAQSVSKYAKQGADIVAKMTAATGIRGTSDEFEKLKNAVAEYAKFHEQRKGTMMTDGDIIFHDKMLDEINALANKYLVRYNNKATKSTYADDRAALVRNIRSEFAASRIQKELTSDDRKLIHANDEKNTERQGSEMRAKAQMIVMKSMLEADGRILSKLAKEGSVEDFTLAAKKQLLHAVVANKYCDKNMNIKLEDFSKVRDLLQKVEKATIKTEGMSEAEQHKIDEYLKDFVKPDFIKQLEESQYVTKLKASFTTQQGREKYAAAVRKQFKLKENGTMEKQKQPEEVISAAKTI